MIERCHNPRAAKWHRYGGRGIVVCERWRIFDNFFADMGPRPSRAHSIDRIDNDGAYQPANCRWATNAVQARNKSTLAMFRLNGVAMCAAELGEALRMKPDVFLRRLRRGYSLLEALL